MIIHGKHLCFLPYTQTSCWSSLRFCGLRVLNYGICLQSLGHCAVLEWFPSLHPCTLSQSMIVIPASLHRLLMILVPALLLFLLIIVVHASLHPHFDNYRPCTPAPSMNSVHTPLTFLFAWNRKIIIINRKKKNKK